MALNKLQKLIAIKLDQLTDSLGWEIFIYKNLKSIMVVSSRLFFIGMSSN